MTLASPFSFVLGKEVSKIRAFALMVATSAWVFSSVNLVLFYTSFEASLVPILLVILGWGYQPERLDAGLSMLFYTLAASLPLLLILVGLTGWLRTAAMPVM